MSRCCAVRCGDLTEQGRPRSGNPTHTRTHKTSRTEARAASQVADGDKFTSGARGTSESQTERDGNTNGAQGTGKVRPKRLRRAV